MLVEADLAELKAEPKIIEAIEAFRSGKVVVCRAEAESTERSGFPNLVMARRNPKEDKSRCLIFELVVSQTK